MNENKEIRIIIVDDHPFVIEGIAKYLEQDPSITMCGQAHSVNEALKLINEQKPDIVVVDISLQDGSNGLELVKAVKSRFPNIHTIVLSMYEESVFAERAIRLGVKGYVQKNTDPGKLLSAIHTVMDGQLYISKDISDSIILKVFHDDGNTDKMNINSLTNRELEIFQMIGNGFGTKEIAQKLGLSSNTVETHRKNIKEKMQITSSASLKKTAVQWVIEQGKSF